MPVFDGRGYPCHVRGVTAAGGLYFLGLPWLLHLGLGPLLRRRRDADYLGERIEERASAATFAAAPALNEAALGS